MTYFNQEGDEIDTWTTKNGEEIKILEMKTSHIQNCIFYLKLNPITYYGGNDPDDFFYEEDTELTNDYIQAFKLELKNRK